MHYSAATISHINPVFVVSNQLTFNIYTRSIGPNPIAPLGGRIESWSDTLAAGQAVRVMVRHISRWAGDTKTRSFCFQSFF